MVVGGILFLTLTILIFLNIIPSELRIFLSIFWVFTPPVAMIGFMMYQTANQRKIAAYLTQ